MKAAKNTQRQKEQVATKKETSLLQSAGLDIVETTLHKIPIIGKALPFILVNLLVGTIFYYLCYGALWIFSRTSEEDGQWFIRYTDLVGKSQTRLTTFAATQIAFFVAGIAACLFTFANLKEKKDFLSKAALITLLPIGLFVISKVLPVYIPIAFLYGQIISLVIVCIVKLLGGDKNVTNA